MKRRTFLAMSGASFLTGGIDIPTFGLASELPVQADDFRTQVSINQQQLRSNLRKNYDFIVCGSGSSGSVVAGRLAENSDVNVLLLEAGGSDDVPGVTDADKWTTNMRTDRVWHFKAQPSESVNNRALSLDMGRVLGGGSSVNSMFWTRGHENDWDYFAEASRDSGWNYKSMLEIYREVEDWRGEPDPKHRGVGGPMFIQPSLPIRPVGSAMLEGAQSLGIPRFPNSNGLMMESAAGCSFVERNILNGKRMSVFRSYTFPMMARHNLTVLTDTMVTKLTFEGNRTTGVEVIHEGKLRRIRANHEVVLSMGAINTPKVLMQSGIGNSDELKRFGIPVVHHLPGVGQNFQDHPLFAGCVWEHRQPDPVSPKEQVYLRWKTDSKLDTPDVLCMQVEGGFTTKPNPPLNSWSLVPGIVRPKSRGSLRLTGANPDDPLQIESGLLTDPDDLKSIILSIEFCRDLANSSDLRPFVKREFAPGALKGKELESLVRNSVGSYSHESCTAKMGQDAMSVVDGQLRTYGVDNLRIADASIMPRVTNGPTMAPCVAIGERAGMILRKLYGI